VLSQLGDSVGALGVVRILRLDGSECDFAGIGEPCNISRGELVEGIAVDSERAGHAHDLGELRKRCQRFRGQGQRIVYRCDQRLRSLEQRRQCPDRLAGKCRGRKVGVEDFLQGGLVFRVVCQQTAVALQVSEIRERQRPRIGDAVAARVRSEVIDSGDAEAERVEGTCRLFEFTHQRDEDVEIGGRIRLSVGKARGQCSGDAMV